MDTIEPKLSLERFRLFLEGNEGGSEGGAAPEVITPVEAPKQLFPPTLVNKEEPAAPIRDLHNPIDPTYNKKHETPRDRMIILLRAANRPVNEIAKVLGIHPQTVRNLCKQEWAREEILKQIHKVSEDEIKKTLIIYSRDAAEVAYDIMMDDKNSPTVRSNCAFSFIKQSLGEKKVIERSSNLAELDEEIASYQREIDQTTKAN